MTWVSKPNNLSELMDFVSNHMDDGIGTVVGTMERVMSSQNISLDEVSLHEAAMMVAPLGDVIASSADRNDVVKWTYVDGEFESLTISHDVKDTTEVNVNPAVGLGVGFDLSLSVKTSVKERSTMPKPTLMMLLTKAESILFGDGGLKPTGGEQALTKWLTKNVRGVNHLLAHMMDEDHVVKTSEIFTKAIEAASSVGDIALLERLQASWHAVQNLPADATPDAKVDTVNELLVAIVIACRRPLAA